MVLKRNGYAVGFLAMVLWAAPAAAATAPGQTTPCTAGPGAAFGVTSYSCAQCAMEMGKDGKPLSLFRAEPVILSVQHGSLLMAGDVIVSVGSQPITSRQGATLFASAPAGATAIAIRRQGKSMTLMAQGTFPCPSQNPPQQNRPPGRMSDKIEQMYEQAAQSSKAGKSVSVSMGDTNRFGFALACVPSCTQVKTADASFYWKFDGEPPVDAVKPGSIAEAAGLKVGDRVLEVDGESVVTETAGLRLWRSSKSPSLTLLIMRNGAKMTIELKAR
jgi:S1-C subfamily serine protease